LQKPTQPASSRGAGWENELVVELIHELSERKNQPLVKVNCAAIPENLLESELFGYEKGAFTGATQRKIGKFRTCQQRNDFPRRDWRYATILQSNC
jgi:transcriptional regulator with GAF, ATPase, and Fis domain